MRPRHLVLALLFLLLVGTVNAELQIGITPVRNAIDWNGTAIYNIVVSGIADPIRLRPATFEWGTIRFDDVILNSGSSTRVYVQPPRDVLMGNYAVEILALSNNNADIRTSDFLKLTVLSELPHIKPTWGIPFDLNPGETKVNLILENAGSTKVDGMTAVLTSPLMSTPVQFDIGSMAKGEAKEFWDANLSVPLNTPAKVYAFKLSVFQNGVLVDEPTYNVNVPEKESVKATVVTEQKLLGTKYKVTLENVGNTLANNYYTISVPSWQRFFIEGKVKPLVSVVDDVADASWQYSLPMGASVTLVYTISFLPLLAILIAALLLLYVSFWYLTQGLSITKELSSAEKALKVKLHIKNNSTKPQRNVIIEDTIPTPLTLSREFATLHPTAIKKVDGAVKLLWKFDVIWPHEEKILTYHVKSSLAISGRVMLPAAKIRKKGDPGEIPKVFLSNRVSVQGRIRATGNEETYK